MRLGHRRVARSGWCEVVRYRGTESELYGASHAWWRTAGIVHRRMHEGWV